MFRRSCLILSLLVTMLVASNVLIDFFLIGPTWNRISFRSGTSCGLKYEICIAEPLLTIISPMQPTICRSAGGWISSWLSLRWPFSLLLVPPFPPALSPPAYKQNPPNNTPRTLKSFPGPLHQTELSHSGCQLSGGCRENVPLCKLRKGSENRKDSAALKGFCAGFSFSAIQRHKLRTANLKVWQMNRNVVCVCSIFQWNSSISPKLHQEASHIFHVSSVPCHLCFPACVPASP